MSKSLLDTDILSEYLKGHDRTVTRHAADYARQHGVFTFTSVAVHEIAYGLELKDATAQLQKALLWLNLKARANGGKLDAFQHQRAVFFDDIRFSDTRACVSPSRRIILSGSSIKFDREHSSDPSLAEAPISTRRPPFASLETWRLPYRRLTDKNPLSFPCNKHLLYLRKSASPTLIPLSSIGDGLQADGVLA